MRSAHPWMPSCPVVMTKPSTDYSFEPECPTLEVFFFSALASVDGGEVKGIVDVVGWYGEGDCGAYISGLIT